MNAVISQDHGVRGRSDCQSVRRERRRRTSPALLFAAALGATFLPPGCNPAGTPPAKIHSTAYYPLTVGSEWVYKGPDHMRIMRVVKHENIDGVPCALVRTLRDDEVVAEEHITVKENGVFAVSVGGEKLPAPYPLLRLPPRPGRTWRVNVTKGGKRSQDVYTIAREQIETPLGKFSAVVLRGQKFAAGKRQMMLIRWFAKDIGIVKEKITIDGKSQDYELVKYTIAK